MAVHKLAQRFWFWQSAAKKGVRQRLAQLRQYVNARSKIGTEIQNFAKRYQKGRVPTFGTGVPNVERKGSRRRKSVMLLGGVGIK